MCMDYYRCLKCDSYLIIVITRVMIMILEIVTHSILLEAMSVDEITRCTIIERKGVEEKQNIWEELYSGFRLYFA